MTNALDGARMLFLIVRQVFDNEVLVDDAWHNCEALQIEHIHVATLESNEQVAVVVQYGCGRYAPDFRIDLVFFHFLDIRCCRWTCGGGRCGCRVASGTAACWLRLVLFVDNLPQYEMIGRLALAIVIVALGTFDERYELPGALYEQDLLYGKRHVLVA